jgi:RNA polymerase sigma-70 factor (ECF subfamily)
MAQPELLHSLVEEGRAAWSFELDPERLATFVEQRAVADEALVERGAEIYLAAACAEGHPDALAIFEREYVAQVPSYIGRLTTSPPLVDEVRQQLRIRMLVGAPPPPRITTYSGDGPLGAFVRVAAIRLAINLLSRDPAARERNLDEPDATALALARVDPEQHAIAARYAPAFQRALDEVVASLSARDKALLRFHAVEQLGIDAIGAIYGVHRATVARWIVQVRARVFAGVRQALDHELRASPSEFGSLLGLVQSRLGLSLSRLLPAEGGR